MRRAKLGDVYAMRMRNGYKLYQWAYKVPRWGSYIRVFPGLYDEIPQNIFQIVQAEHSYIIGFDASWAYRVGLAQFIENIPIPDEYPLPQYRLHFRKHQLDDDLVVWVRPSPSNLHENINEIYSFNVAGMEELPGKYQNIKLIDSELTAPWLMFLFDYDFDLSDLKRFNPGYVLGEKLDEVVENYENYVEELDNRYRAERQKKKIE